MEIAAPANLYPRDYGSRRILSLIVSLIAHGAEKCALGISLRIIHVTISVSGSAVPGCRDHLDSVRQKFSSIEERKKRFCGGGSTTTMGRCIVGETTVFKSIYNFKTGNRLCFDFVSTRGSIMPKGALDWWHRAG
jgi:hypothetical protein